MQTGIYIRACPGISYKNYDIGDPELPDEEVVKWLREHEEESGFMERLVLILLGRPKPIVEGEPRTK